MNVFLAMMESALKILSMDMTIYGFTFSYFDVLLWGMAVTIVVKIVIKFFE